MKKRSGKRWIFFVILAVSSAAVLLALSASAKNDKVYHMVFIPKIIDENNDFWVSVIEGANMGAKEGNVELEIEAGPSEEDWQSQNELIEKAIAEKPDAIIVAPCSYTESTEVLKKVKDAGICLTLVDSVVNEDIQDLSVATDNIAAGRQLGEFAAGYLTQDSKVALIEHVKGSSTAMDRETGVREGLGDKAGCIKETIYSGSSEERAYELTKELIFKYPDLDMIIGLNEPSAVGAANAIKNLNLTSKINAVGFDSSLNEIRLMEDGIFSGIVIQKPYNMGYLGVQQTWMHLRGEKVEKNLESGSELVTPENLYSEENQKLLFPFTGNKN
ncbi:MAG TPA: substrate-binding domain-containing protein [Lachnospiraceae bacterium]|nr:substrate-binding domain-containing protein [Lachnospiraceae bacterium]